LVPVAAVPSFAVALRAVAWVAAAVLSILGQQWVADGKSLSAAVRMYLLDQDT
jgi:hypothetical protein